MAKFNVKLGKKTFPIEIDMIAKILCLVMMVAFVVCQFLPYWTFETISKEDKKLMVLYDQEVEPKQKTVSIAEAVWMIKDNEDLFGDPDDHPEKLVTNHWAGIDVQQNDIVGMPFLVMVCLFFGFIFFLLNKKNLWPCLFAMGAGGYSLLTLLNDPAKVFKPWKGDVRIVETDVWGDIISEEVKFFEAGITYNVQLIVSAALLATAFIAFVFWMIRVVKWFTVKEVKY